MSEEVCGYCINHQWSDHLRYHTCIKEPVTSTDEHEHFRKKCEFSGTCGQFRDSGKFKNPKEE